MDYKEQYKQVLSGDTTPGEIRILKRNIREMTGKELSPELMEFRDIIFSSHWFLEDELERILSKHLYRSARPGYYKDKNRAERYKEFEVVTDKYFGKKNLSFNDKVFLLKDLDIIDNHMVQRLGRINKARNKFSHPSPSDLEQYANPQIKLVLLTVIQEAIIELAGVTLSFGV